MIQKFRKKPVVIEAIQFDRNLNDISIAFPNQVMRVSGGNLIIPTLEGDMTASPGDWIIRGVKGEVYPCKPDIFEATYELVDDTASHVVHDVTDAENIDATRFFSALDEARDDGDEFDDYVSDDGYDDE